MGDAGITLFGIFELKKAASGLLTGSKNLLDLMANGLNSGSSLAVADGPMIGASLEDVAAAAQSGNVPAILASLFNLDNISEDWSTVKQGADAGGTDEVSWYNPDGSINYPPNNGAVPGTEVEVSLKPGRKVGRYGDPTSKSHFLTEVGADPDTLALPPNTDPSNYHVYEVLKEIPDTIQSEIADWAGSSGGGLQFDTPYPIQWLIKEGYLMEVLP